MNPDPFRAFYRGGPLWLRPARYLYAVARAAQTVRAGLDHAQALRDAQDQAEVDRAMSLSWALPR